MHRILTYVVQGIHFKFQRTISTNASKLIIAVFGQLVPENLQAAGFLEKHQFYLFCQKYSKVFMRRQLLKTHRIRLGV